MSYRAEKAIITVLAVMIGLPAACLIVWALWYTLLHTVLGVF